MDSETALSQEVWERTPPEAQVYIRELKARVVALEATVQRLEVALRQLEATVQQVREQLQQDSRTSSRPPSSDPPQALGKRPRREPSGRRPGGQPGHEGQTRALMPVEEVDVVIPVTLQQCPRCQHPLQGADPYPQRHQVAELPRVKPMVTEYQLYQLVCPACGEAIRAELPAGVPTGGFGPRAQVCQMFHWWHRVRDGTLAHASFGRYMRPIRQEVERLLETGQMCGVPKTEGVCREILKRRQALWTFVRHPEVELTNNAAERAIRPGVLWRKGSFGTQSAQGSRFVEAMVTVVATLKRQHPNVLDYTTTACAAALRGESPPSLIPTPVDLETLIRSAP